MSAGANLRLHSYRSLDYHSPKNPFAEEREPGIRFLNHFFLWLDLDPPLNLTVKMKSFISVLLKWTAPQRSHEDVVGYKVQRLLAIIVFSLTFSDDPPVGVDFNENVFTSDLPPRPPLFLAKQAKEPRLTSSSMNPFFGVHRKSLASVLQLTLPANSLSL